MRSQGEKRHGQELNNRTINHITLFLRFKYTNASNIIQYEMKELNSGLQEPSWTSPSWNSSIPPPTLSYFWLYLQPISSLFFKYQEFALCPFTRYPPKNSVTYMGHWVKVILRYWSFLTTCYKIALYFISFALSYFS